MPLKLVKSKSRIEEALQAHYKAQQITLDLLSSEIEKLNDTDINIEFHSGFFGRLKLIHNKNALVSMRSCLTPQQKKNG